MKIKRTIDVFIKRLEGSSKQSELQEAKEMAISDITEAIQSTQAPQTLNTARAALRYLLQHAFAFCDGMTQWVQYIEADGDEADKEARRDYHRAQAVLDVIERVDRECEIWGICSPLGNLESTDNELCEDVGQPLIVEVSKTAPADDPDRIDLGEYLRNADIEEIATREIDALFTQLEEYARNLSPEPSTAMERSTTAGTATPSPDDTRANEAETTPPEPSTASASTPMESSEAAGTATASPDDSPILSKYPARVTAEIHERLERANILTIEKGKYKWTGKNKNKLAYILLCLYYGESNPKEWGKGDAPAQYIASFCPDTNGLARTISKTKTTIKENFPKTLEGVKRVFEYSVQAEEERQKDERMKRLNLDIEKTDLKFPIRRQDAKQ